MPLMKLYDVVLALCHFPALTLMVFTRSRLGLRILSIPALLSMFFLLFTVGFWSMVISLFSGFSFSARGLNPWLFLFAIAMLGMGLWQHRQRWKGLMAGENWHTYNRGFSHLLPILPMRPTYVYRIGEPVVCMVLGLIIARLLSLPLGIWMVIAGACIAISEQIVYDQQLNRALDLLDAALESDVQKQDLDFVTGKTPEQVAARVKPEDVGLPTNEDADDIQRQLERRRKRRAAAPDNLAESASA